MKTVQLAMLPPDGGPIRIVTVQGAPPRSPRCILVVPGADVSGREVAVVGATVPQRQAAALAGLAGELASAMSQVACVLGSAREAGLALIASHAVIDSWRKAAAKAGLTVDAIVPDHALLPRAAEGAAHIADRGDAVVRTAQAGFACQPELLDVLTSGLHRIEVDFEQAAIEAVRSGRVAEAPNLLSARREPNVAAPRRFPVLALSAAIALAMVSAAPWVQALRLNAEARSLRAETVEVARAALPAARRIVDPIAQLREAASPQQYAEVLYAHAAGLLEGLARSPGVTMSRLELGEDGTVRASLSAPDLVRLQPLRDHLGPLGIRAAETPIASTPTQLNVELTLTGAP